MSVTSWLKTQRVEGYDGDGVARTLRTGKGGSIHSVDASGRPIPGGKLVEAFDMLGIANLVVGVANLGVGIYAAVKANKAHAEIKSGITTVQVMLRHQSRVLEALETTTREKFDEVLLALAQGKIEILDAVVDVTKARRTDELGVRVHKLHDLKQEVADSALHDGRVSTRHAEELERVARDLHAWIKTRLAEPSLPVQARQALVLADMDAAIAKQDAQLFLDGDAARAAALRQVRALREEVAAEVVRLHQGATRWDIVTYVREQVGLYVILDRALAARARDLGEPDDGKPLVGPLDGWDDALPSLPQSTHELGSASVGASTGQSVPVASAARDNGIPLRTVADWKWYCSAFEVSEDTPVASRIEVSRLEVARQLGVRQQSVSLQVMKPFLSASLWRQYRERVTTAFSAQIDEPSHLHLPVADVSSHEALSSADLRLVQELRQCSDLRIDWRPIRYSGQSGYRLRVAPAASPWPMLLIDGNKIAEYELVQEYIPDPTVVYRFRLRLILGNPTVPPPDTITVSLREDRRSEIEKHYHGHGERRLGAALEWTASARKDLVEATFTAV